MKKSFITLTLLLFTLFASAQVQKGTVRLQNSGKKPISGVQILFTGAKASESDASGAFRLVFAGKKPGDLIFMEKIHKQGFELVNFKELEVNKLGNQDMLGVDIILTPTGTLEAARREYYRISNNAMMAGLDREKANLKAELEKAKITQQQYLQKYEQLKNQYEEQLKNLDVLAEKFARTNFDDVGAVQREALELFKAGKIDEALKKLQSADLIGQAKKVIEEEKRLNILQQDINEQKARAQKQKIETIGAIYLEADIYLLRYETAKAEKLYDQLLILDSTNLEVLQKVADFYRANGRYVKALRLYSQIVAHPQINDLQKADNHVNMGEIYYTITNYSQAKESYSQSYTLYKKMLEEEKEDISYQLYLKLFSTGSKLSLLYGILGEGMKSEDIFDENENWISKLKEVKPDIDKDIAFKKFRARESAEGGKHNTKIGALGMALSSLQYNNQVAKEIFQAEPNSIEAKHNLAISCALLVENFLENAVKQFYLPIDVPLSLDSALFYSKEYNRLEKEIFTANSNSLQFKNNLAVSYSSLGDTYFTRNELTQALTSYQECNRLAKELVTADANDTEFKKNLANSYQKLGYFFEYQQDKAKAKSNYQEAQKIYQFLIQIFPDSQAYKDELAYVEEKLKDL